MEATFHEVDSAADMGALSDFICRGDWPFHRMRKPGPEHVREMTFAGPATRSFWIDVDGRHAGLLRLLDLDDIGDGSPVFDLRIAEQFRGLGIGRRAVSWLAGFVFREYPEAHRIEATTRIDNAAMRRVLERCGFQLEGRLRETWMRDDGVRADTAIYGLLRRDCRAPDAGGRPGPRLPG